jgi:siroheme synthase (precorrin-2 oxidase/ferrochelatase)
VPIPQIASLAKDLSARAVAISVSSSSKGPSTAAALRRLREALPRRILLITGGEGAPASRAGIDSMGSLRELDAWGRRVATGLPVAGNEPTA